MRSKPLILVIALVVPGTACADPRLPHDAGGKSLGVASCSSSLCHGSVAPWKGDGVRQDEYVIWSRADRHSRAYHTLLTERSREIAVRLGLKEPAHRASECLDCHAHHVPAARRGEKFDLSDGVGCEGCHGPSEGWIRTHLEPGATRAESLRRGLYPIWNPVARARLCVSCHFGSPRKFVTHRMMVAGHPRMSFELDTFVRIQPPHFRDRRDVTASARDGVRAWAVGQAVASEALLEILIDEARRRDGLFPELALFDCHACHRPMSGGRSKQVRSGVVPGAVRLNDANLLMLRHIVRRVMPAAAGEVDRATAALHAAIARGADAPERARVLLELLREILPRIAAHRFTPEELRAIILGLIEDGLRGEYTDYQGAEQTAMAVQAVADVMVRAGQLRAAALRPAIDRVLEAVGDDERYSPERFAHALGALRAALHEAVR